MYYTTKIHNLSFVLNRYSHYVTNAVVVVVRQIGWPPHCCCCSRRMLLEGCPRNPGCRTSSEDCQTLEMNLKSCSFTVLVLMCCAIWAMKGLKAKAVIRKVCQLANSVWGAVVMVTQNAWVQWQRLCLSPPENCLKVKVIQKMNSKHTDKTEEFVLCLRWHYIFMYISSQFWDIFITLYCTVSNLSPKYPHNFNTHHFKQENRNSKEQI